MDIEGFKSTKQYGFPEISPRGPDPPKQLGHQRDSRGSGMAVVWGKWGVPLLLEGFFLWNFPT